MGWWTQDEKGRSFSKPINPNVPTMAWGDGPADHLDAAIANIVSDFERDQGRTPTRAELHAGLDFALGSFAPSGPYASLVRL